MRHPPLGSLVDFEGRVDDAAILREIARRIRDGIDGTPPGQPAPPEAVPAAAEQREAELISRLAHELKNPLSAMVAAAEIMSTQRLGPMENATYLAYAQNIAESGRHALTIIDRTLKNWREPTAADPLEFVQLDLNGIVERTAAVLRPVARDREITIATQLEPRLPHLIADPTSLRQILLNLVINASKYAGAGGEITITTRYVVDGPVILQVNDTGPGMSAAQVAQAREPTTETQSRITPAQGTGLGLRLVHRLAAANGAAFDIESAPGLGTSVTLSFAKDKVVPV